MTLPPHNRLAYALRMVRTWTHLRHYRGHNVHSPFVYGLIRQAIVPRKAKHPDEAAYRELRDSGLPHRAAVQLLNLQAYCPEYALRIVPAAQTPHSTAPEAPAIDCLLLPRWTPTRYRQIREQIAAHDGASIDNRRYVLLIHDARLTKKHYNL